MIFDIVIPWLSKNFELPNLQILLHSSEVTSGSSLESRPESPVAESEIPAETSYAPNKSFLLRLFESTLFDMSMAITYLFSSKELGVQSYIGMVPRFRFISYGFTLSKIDFRVKRGSRLFAGNKLFCFAHNEVDFYLPQLINMYIQVEDIAEVIHPYLMYRLVTSSI